MAVHWLCSCIWLVFFYTVRRSCLVCLPRTFTALTAGHCYPSIYLLHFFSNWPILQNNFRVESSLVIGIVLICFTCASLSLPLYVLPESRSDKSGNYISQNPCQKFPAQILPMRKSQAGVRSESKADSNIVPAAVTVKLTGCFRWLKWDLTLASWRFCRSSMVIDFSCLQFLNFLVS